MRQAFLNDQLAKVEVVRYEHATFSSRYGEDLSIRERRRIVLRDRRHVMAAAAQEWGQPVIAALIEQKLH